MTAITTSAQKWSMWVLQDCLQSENGSYLRIRLVHLPMQSSQKLPARNGIDRYVKKKMYNVSTQFFQSCVSTLVSIGWWPVQPIWSMSAIRNHWSAWVHQRFREPDPLELASSWEFFSWLHLVSIFCLWTSTPYRCWERRVAGGSSEELHLETRCASNTPRPKKWKASKDSNESNKSNN